MEEETYNRAILCERRERHVDVVGGEVRRRRGKNGEERTGEDGSDIERCRRASAVLCASRNGRKSYVPPPCWRSLRERR
jgi:hypothetical protein